MRKPYLEHIKIDSFGAFSNKVVGPFTPGLNVVTGKNEAGKTSVATFVDGVLFGWREARGSVNTYKPKNAERSGSLLFEVPREGQEGFDSVDGGDEGAAASAPCGADLGAVLGSDNDAEQEEEWREAELFRTRNSEGLQGEVSLVSDIDRETFETMFLLTSDELRSLRNTSDVTARLLTAGSGTSASPAHALSQIEERLASYTSRSAGAEKSLVRLAAEKDELRAQIAEASDEAERYRRESEEFHDMGPQRDDMVARLNGLNAEIESLAALRAQVEKLDADIAEFEENIAALDEEEADLRAGFEPAVDDELAPLVALSAGEERALRDRIDALAAEEAKREHAVDLAQDDCTSSKASYDALLEAESIQGTPAYKRSKRTVQVLLSIAVPLFFAIIGVYLFTRGSELPNPSFTTVGLILILFAVILVAAALIMLLRPDKEDDAMRERRKDAQWVMLQDQKKLEACLEARAAFQQRAREQLDQMGLGAAQGSIRQSRELLDAARDARTEENLFRQRLQAISLRRTRVEDGLAKAREQRQALFDDVPLPGGEDSLASIDAVLAQKSRQRKGLLEASEEFNRRYGELKQELSRAERQRGFDELKQRYQLVATREEEACREYASLLLAKRMLESAIAAWESKSQPEVYRQASRLLSMMTNGRWTKVEMTDEGRLRVVDAVKTARDPVQLSLGTCQQLYLSLRIALLMEADNVGRAVPILADDILVNFDASRRAGAALALAELAQVRQVIVFTCHEEVVDALREADPSLNEVAL